MDTLTAEDDCVPDHGRSTLDRMTIFLELNWGLIAALSVTGIGMALLSSLVGMRQKVEMPAWWLLYAVWVMVVLLTNQLLPFWTILISSTITGVLHGCTQGLLIEQYIKNNPWYAEKMTDQKFNMAVMFIVMGFGIGIGFGALVGAIAWGVKRWIL